MALTRTTAGFLLNDPFTLANGPLFPTAAYTKGGDGVSADWNILGNLLRHTGAAGQNMVISTHAAQAGEIVVEGSFVRQDGAVMPMIGLSNAAVTAWLILMYGTGGPRWEVWASTGGNLANNAASIRNSGVWKLRRKPNGANTDITAWIDGIQIFNFTTAALGGGAAVMASFGSKTGTADFDDLKAYTANTISCNNVPTGWKIRCNGITSAAAVNNTTLVLDLAGTSCPSALVELLDPSGAVRESFAGVIYGGDIFSTSIDPHPLPAVSGNLRLDLKAELSSSFVDGTAIAPYDRSPFHRQAVVSLGVLPAYKAAIFPTGAPSFRTVIGAAGFAVPRPVEDDWSMYAAVRNPSSNATSSGGTWYLSGGFIDCERGGVGNDWGLNLRADGKLHLGVGNPDTGGVGTKVLTDGLPHIISMTRTKSTGRVKVWVDGVLDIDITASTASLTYPIWMYFGRTEAAGQVTADYGRVTLWDAVHSDAERQSVEQAFATEFVNVDWAIDKDALVVADLVNQFGFLSNAAGGGVQATFAVNSGGYIDLPATVDRAKPFMFAALIEYGGGAARAAVKLYDPVDTSFKGFSVSMDGNDVRAESGATSYFRLAPVASGTRMWIGVGWDATGNVVAFAHRLANGGLGNPDAFLETTLYDHLKVVPKTISGGAGEALQFLTRIRVDISSTTSKIISIVARQGTLSRGPSAMNPVVNADTTPKLRVPPYSPAGTAKNLVVVFHGANSSEDQGSDVNLTDLGVTVASLVTAGYLVATMRGTDDFSGTTYSGPKASNWGASASLITFWKAWIDRVKVLYNIDRVFFFGQSMGLVNALNMHALYPTLASAIAGISGVANLSYAYSNEGFAALINAAYGTGTLAAIQPFDPVLRAALYNIPIKLWHGDADATINYAQHANVFAAAVNALFPGKAATVIVPGGTHLGASVYDGAAVRAFYAGVGSTPAQPVLSIAAFPTLTTGAFASVPSGDTHRASQWQVTLATDPTFAAPVYDSGVDLVNLTSLTIALAALPKNVALIARVRHQGQGLIWSAYSASQAIAAIQPSQPVCSGGFPILSSSAYASYPATDLHVSSQWQVTRSTDAAYAATIFDSGEDFVHLTSVEITSIIFFTALIARVRHRSASGAWSPWSANLAIGAIAPWTVTDLGPELITPGGTSDFDFGRGPAAGKTVDTLYTNQQMSVTVNRGDLLRADTVTMFFPNYVVNGPAAPSAQPTWQGVVGTGASSAQPQSIMFDKLVRSVDFVFYEITFFGNLLIAYDELGVEIGRCTLDALWIGAHLGPVALSAHAIIDAGSNRIKSVTFAPSGDWIAYGLMHVGLDVPDRLSEWSPTDAAPDNVWAETDASPATVWSP